MIPALSRLVYLAYPDIFDQAVLTSAQARTFSNLDKIKKVMILPGKSEVDTRNFILRNFILSVCQKRGRFKRILQDIDITITNAGGREGSSGFTFDRIGAAAVIDINAASFTFGAATICYLRSNRLARFEHDDISVSSLAYREVPSPAAEIAGFGPIKTPWGVNNDVSKDVKAGITYASGSMQRHLINVTSALQSLPSLSVKPNAIHAYLGDLPWYVSSWLTLLAAERLGTSASTWRIETGHSPLPSMEGSAKKGLIGKKWGWKILAGQNHTFVGPPKYPVDTLSIQITDGSDKTLYDAGRQGWDKVSGYWKDADSFDRWIQNGPSRAYWFEMPFESKDPRAASIVIGDFSTTGPQVMDQYTAVGSFIDRFESTFNGINFPGSPRGNQDFVGGNTDGGPSDVRETLRYQRDNLSPQFVNIRPLPAGPRPVASLFSVPPSTISSYGIPEGDQNRRIPTYIRTFRQ